MALDTRSGVLEIDALTYGPGSRWNKSAPYGSGVTVTYSFPDAVPWYYQAGTIADFQPFDEDWRQAARDALARYSAVANITFVEAPDAIGGQLRFAFNAQDGSAGYASPPSAWYGGQNDSSGDVWINSSYSGKEPADSFSTLLHEIGHALGLKHPGRYTVFESNAGDPGPFLPAYLDSRDHTVMSYNYGQGRATVLGPLDVQAVQFLYGPRGTSAQLGHLVYDDDGAHHWVGDAGPNYLHGMGGDDTLSGGGDNDMLSGGSGDDQMQGDAGDDLLTGGPGNDYLAGGGEDDRIYGNMQADTILGGDGNDTLFGGQGTDLLFGEGGRDWVYGNMADDTLVAGAGDDTLYGGQGDDVLYSETGDAYLYGNLGNDVLYGGTDRNAMNGGQGDDTLVGGSGNDIFRFDSNSGRDVIEGFSRRSDYIVVSSNANGMGFTSGSDIFARLSDSADGAVIDLGSGNSVLILGVRKASLQSWNFLTWEQGLM